MLRQGQTLKAIFGKGAPIMAHEFGAVCAALASGLKFSSDKPLLDTISGDEENPIREHIWTFDGEGTADFIVPMHAAETFSVEHIDFNEFVRRFNDLDWCKANSDHAIAYMRAMWNQIVRLRADLRNMKPLIKLEKVIEDGEETRTITVYIPQDATEEEKAEFMKMFDEAA